MPHKKTSAKKPKSSKVRPAQNTTRKLQQPNYRSFRLSKRIKHPSPKLTSGYGIFKACLKHLWAHKKLFAGITLVYLLLSLIFVRGFTFTGDLTAAKEALAEVLEGTSGQLAASFTILGLLAGTNSPANELASTYQAAVIAIVSLSLIWALRQTHAKERVTTKDAFYKAMYPLVPFILVILVISLQLAPILIGAFLYGAAVGGGVAITATEQLLFLILVFLMAIWSLYMISSSIFALYVVTLPEMTPIRALRSAKGLVQFRRWTVMRKILFLPFIICVVGIIIMLPVILLLTPAAEVIFLLLTALVLPVIHSYVYSLYRELL